MTADNNTLSAPPIVDPVRQQAEVVEFNAEPSLHWDRYDWSRVGLHIMAAGTLYPVVVVIIGIGIELGTRRIGFWHGNVPNMQVPDLYGFLGNAVYYGIFGGGFVGTAWAGIVTLFVLPLAYLIAQSIRLRVGFVMFAACCGGLIGFVAVAPVAAVVGRNLHLWSEVVQVLAIGPGLATILGQAGAAIGANHEVSLYPDATVATGAAVENSRRYQFNLRHLLWFLFWISLMLSVLKLIGAPLEFMVPVLFGWVAYQAATLYVGHLIVTRTWPRWRAWRAARRST